MLKIQNAKVESTRFISENTVIANLNSTNSSRERNAMLLILIALYRTTTNQPPLQ